MHRSNRKHRLLPIFDFITGLFATIFLISAGLILAINARFLYYLDIKWFSLPQSTGLSYEIIKRNYDDLIDYCQPFHKGPLSFSDLPSSASGLSHFAEVKVLFQVFYLLFAVLGILLVVIFIYKLKKGQSRFLLVSGITAIVLPVIVAAGCMINFEKIFYFMHKIFFRNNDWLFDPMTDPIINLLPEAFFLQCAIVIVTVVITGSILLLIWYRHRKRKDSTLLPYTSQKNYIY